ncbi:MAG: CPBP family intramembrane metalloprotease [candidate division Zixibacteria bacterium]|nr:CPBP family intramembrane metalloprotease [candidate division Zixibacteria bacterium]
MLRIIGRILITLLVAMAIIIIASAIMMSLSEASLLLEKNSWLMGFIPHTAMLVLSTLILLMLGKGNLGQYGYKLPSDFSFTKIVMLPLVFGVAANIILAYLPKTDSFLPEGYSFPQIIIFIWLYASVCEEIYTRGLIQGMLSPLAQHGLTILKTRVSLPVIIGAAFFSLMHLMAFATTMPSVTLIFFLLVAFLLGVLAGNQLEKTGSLIPAIIIHIIFNVSGSIVDAVVKFF